MMSVFLALILTIFFAAPAWPAITGPECQICHLEDLPISEADIFFTAGRPQAKQDTVCYSCHDGSVMDSRAKLFTGLQHPPSPQNPQGLTCGSCHTPHRLEAGVFMRFPNRDSSFCARCHPRYQGAGNHPEVKLSPETADLVREAGGIIGNGNRLICQSCHRLHGAPGKSLTILPPGEAKGLCRICHSTEDFAGGEGPGTQSHPLRRKVSASVQIPLTQEGEMDCWTCHQAHGGILGSRQLRPQFVEDSACQGCHPEISVDSIGNHRKIDPEKPCRNCHLSHRAAGTALLKVAGDPDSLCVACHSDRLPRNGVGDNHPLGSPPPETRISPKIILAGGKIGTQGEIFCATCHDIHPTKKNPSLLVLPDDILCFYCHSEFLVSQDLGSRSGSHPVKVAVKDSKIREKAADAGWPLTPEGEVSCLTCHRNHDSQNPPLLRGSPQLNPSEGCLFCHPRKETVALGKHNLILSPATVNSRGEPANISGLCGACHFAHGWAREPIMGADEATGLCWSCHSQQKPGGEILVDNLHYLGNPPENMMTTLPLFNLQGGRDPNGRIACPTCHDPHQWDPPSPEKRTRPKDKATAATSFLRLPNDTAGLLCLDCHSQRKTLFGGAHDLASLGIKPLNIKGENVSQTGPCGACHLPHQSDPLFLWARPRVVGRLLNPVDGLCLGCHMDGQMAASKQAGPTGHPKKRFNPAEGKPDFNLPLFTYQGKRTKDAGLVACSTCHDSHSASLRTDQKTSDLCLSCHPSKEMAVSNPHRPSEGVDLCTNCHLSHNGPVPGILWKDPIPTTDDYHQFICRSCHSEGGRAGPLPGEKHHPMGPDASRFPPPEELPLYDPVGGTSPEGVISCPTCHDLHGKGPEMNELPNPALLRVLDLSFVNLCISCHSYQGNVVGTDHDLAITSPGFTNPQGLGVEGYGVCTPCHSAHSPIDRPGLWGFIPSENSPEPNAGICLFCHQMWGSAAAKVPEVLYRSMRLNDPRPFHSYVLRDLVFPFSDEGVIMLFDEDGEQSWAGYLTCKSCHDPHVWSRSKPTYGDWTNREGDERSSFLKAQSPLEVSGSFCGVCHGFQSAPLYKKYHQKETDTECLILYYPWKY